MEPRGRILAAASGFVVCLLDAEPADCRTADDDAELSVDVLESVLADRVVVFFVVEVEVLPLRCDWA